MEAARKGDPRWCDKRICRTSTWPFSAASLIGVLPRASGALTLIVSNLIVKDYSAKSN
jgi:hypothetical protein